MIVNKNAIQKLEDFKNKSKFDEEIIADPSKGVSYPGLSDPKQKRTLSVLINKVADDFITTTQNYPTEKKFQDNIKRGLSSFSMYLDTQDQERVCHYFEELMDCVGLKSSDGQLNNWMYGFNPSKKTN